MSDWILKHRQIQALLAERQLDALLLKRVSSFAWATDGAASYVNTASSEGAAALLITPSGNYVLTNNIEATRLEQEEELGAQGWEIRAAPWHADNGALAELSRELRLGADGPYPGAADLSGEMARLRAALSPAEGDRFRVLGRLCAEAMDRAIRSIQPGQSENEIAAVLANETLSRGAQPIVNLVATDERVYRFRHPLPTDKRLERYAMLVLCGRKRGLVCSITRLIHFGRLPDELRLKAEATARIDAIFHSETRPGQRLADIFGRATAAYARAGLTDEWQLHHQGGPAGYEPREFIATPASHDIVVQGQAYAWNPSITGCKSEDTILVGETENKVLTTIEGWPTLPVTLDDGRVIERPAILQVT